MGRDRDDDTSRHRALGSWAPAELLLHQDAPDSYAATLSIEEKEDEEDEEWRDFPSPKVFRQHGRNLERRPKGTTDATSGHDSCSRCTCSES